MSSLFTVVKSENAKGNPFTIPSDNDIFMLRDKERQKKKEVYMHIIFVSFF
jgi:hypothetical protein